MLRELKDADAALMLEWMKNKENNRYFLKDFSDMTIQKCQEFIKRSKEDENNYNLAVCNGQDEYLGTVSLKNIDKVNQSAEYAISLRNVVIGKGVAKQATDEILKIAFEELNLNKVYLNVLSDNIRAIKFYEKYGFILEGVWKEHYVLRNKKRDLLWFRILNVEWENKDS